MHKTITDILMQKVDLAVRLLSVYYPFTQAELDEYWGILYQGDAHYSVYLSDTEAIYQPSLGLSFNRSLPWTDALKSRWTCGFFDPFNGYVVGVPGGHCEFDERDERRGMLPLSLLEEIESLNDCATESWMAWRDPDDYEGPTLLELSDFTNIYLQLQPDEFEDLVTLRSRIVIMNRSIWHNTVVPALDRKVVYSLLQKRRKQLQEVKE